ncbi:37S ribosomal protein S12 [Trichophyton verrucosum HKI 0517]|uniref:37S ribosomal protein S12 n=1 Tax=Trichophyton verrucosum (strain HKI 0517) TaxID=663202 RepID=D4D609_TRIVH|nr:37S ribosomal protein S12 [Trichophyton verrucosum HKI 0517]EFE42718.1 37S ribosomal protein S12 [Trichophyton verrucosum HKI 0517]
MQCGGVVDIVDRFYEKNTSKNFQFTRNRRKRSRQMTMALSPSLLTMRFFRHIIQRQFPSTTPKPHCTLSALSSQCLLRSSALNAFHKSFSTTSQLQATLNQVRRGCRSGQKARKKRSPALVNRPQLKGVCLKTQVEKPKKPNSGERKTARVKLTSGKVITAYIPGEGRTFGAKLVCDELMV